MSHDTTSISDPMQSRSKWSFVTFSLCTYLLALIIHGEPLWAVAGRAAV